MSVTKRYTMECAHRIPGHMKCGETHGHSYKLDVEVAGPIDSKSGMVFDYHDLDTLVTPWIQKYDHQYLNDKLKVTTAENIAHELAVYLTERLSDIKSLCQIRKVRVYETERCHATWRNNACR